MSTIIWKNDTNSCFFSTKASIIQFNTVIKAFIFNLIS